MVTKRIKLSEYVIFVSKMVDDIKHIDIRLELPWVQNSV